MIKVCGESCWCRRFGGCRRRRRRQEHGLQEAGGCWVVASIAGHPASASMLVSVSLSVFVSVSICICIYICICICACICGGRSMACRSQEAAAASIAAAARSPTPAIRPHPAHQSQAVSPGGKYFLLKKNDSSTENFQLEVKRPPIWTATYTATIPSFLCLTKAGQANADFLKLVFKSQYFKADTGPRLMSCIKIASLNWHSCTVWRHEFQVG